MEKDLIKFNDNIKVISKDINEYTDEKGNMYIIPTGQLLCSCTYMELDKSEYTVAKFNNQIEDLEYNEIEVERASRKYDRTKKQEDMYILENKKIKVKQVWVVTNGLKISKSFTNKEDALKLAKEINEMMLKDII